MIVVGTRPEIVKMAPLVRAFEARGLPFVFVHCGQHYDYNMSQQFIDELELPRPDFGFEVRASSSGVQTARILGVMDRVVRRVGPRVVLVEGDTNGTLASALAALKLNVSVGHVEAGLRSFDLRMPEEHNRRLVDHVSRFLFAPTEVARENLVREGVWGSVFVTGNTVIDAVVQHLPLAEGKSDVMSGVGFGRFVLATVHRAENVDDPVVLRGFVDVFVGCPVPVVFPVHPRTRKRLRQQGLLKRLLGSGNVLLLPPVGYLDFLVLMKRCELILTDSGGVQEEATAPVLRKRVLVLRLSTERPEAVSAGFAEVVGVEKCGVLEALDRVLKRKGVLPRVSPFGDGNAALKIADIVACECG